MKFEPVGVNDWLVHGASIAHVQEILEQEERLSLFYSAITAIYF